MVVNIDTTIGEQLTSLQALLDEGARLEPTLRSTSVVVADPGDVRQVLSGLTRHARRRVARGTLTLETGDVSIDDRGTAEHPQLSPGLYVSLRLRDSGGSIDADVLARLFDPVFSAQHPDTADLPSVHTIIRRAGGAISVRSRQGLGTEVTVLWPGVSAIRTRPAPGSPLVAQGETVLVVDDQDAVREFVVDLLREYGYQVLDAACGATALSIIDSGTPVDLLLTDVVMPSLNGTELAVRVRTQRPEQKVLFMSGFVPASVTLVDADARTTSHIAKPFTAAMLIRSVRDLLDA